MSDSGSTRPVYTERKTYKRPYRKSTSGCKACKTRKIKCDEARPACTNCRKRFIDPACCKYELPASQKKSPAADSNTSSSSSTSLDRLVTSNPIGTNSSSLLELKLMHHYTRSTCGRQSLRNMHSPTNADSMWEIDIPQLAFSNDIVLSAMLGIAAFNLLSLSPNDRELAVASRLYFNKAVVKQRDAVSCVDRHNAEPLLVSAVLLAHLNWLYSYSAEAQPIGVDLSTFKMCKGASLLAQKAAPFTPQYDFLSKLVLKLEDGDSKEYDVDFMAKIHEDMDSLLQSFDSEVTARDRLAYEGAAADVIHTSSLFASGLAENSVLEQQIITNLHRVPPRFIYLLEKGDPIAMAIMARNISLLAVFKDDSAWWIHGAGQNNVVNKALRAIDKQMPPAYQWTMEFPFKVLAKEVKVL